VVQVAPDSFIMIYHSAVFTPLPTGGLSPKWSLARAVSKDGVEWEKTGLCNITGRDPSPDAFDTKGLGTRDVVVLDDGGVCASPLHRCVSAAPHTPRVCTVVSAQLCLQHKHLA
jgi:hypothetical protein